ncbi:soluble lytic murein transglycosylase [Azospirillaceae bacterium]
MLALARVIIFRYLNGMLGNFCHIGPRLPRRKTSFSGLSMVTLAAVVVTVITTWTVLQLKDELAATFHVHVSSKDYVPASSAAPERASLERASYQLGANASPRVGEATSADIAAAASAIAAANTESPGDAASLDVAAEAATISEPRVGSETTVAPDTVATSDSAVSPDSAVSDVVASDAAPSGAIVAPPIEGATIDAPLALDRPGARALITGNPSARAVRLSALEIARYRAILAAQASGDWAEADQGLSRLHDRRLVGHILMRRYLGANGYRASYEELRSWLKRYADHPGAERIYALAQRRQEAGEPPPPEPPSPMRPAAFEPPRAAVSSVAAGLSVAPRARRQVVHRDYALAERINDHLRAGKVGAALSLLGKDELALHLSDLEYDSLRARVASALYYEGHVRSAQILSSASAVRSGDALPDAHWIAGLSSWRQGAIDRAVRHFRAMASIDGLPAHQAAAAAFWAARSLKRIGQDAAAQTWFVRAAAYRRTFHGLLAQQSLGVTPSFEWRPPKLAADHFAALNAMPGGKRAIGLFQVGLYDAAEQELRRLAPGHNALMVEILLTLADRARLAGLATVMSNNMASLEGLPGELALYPLPPWQPRGGFAIDRALMYAVMRQESRFDPRLVSRKGATGLMQVMPGTAQEIGEPGANFIGDDRAKLFQPELNLSLAQRYISQLLERSEIKGDLISMIAAYNAGPGALARWRQHELNGVDDALLFIESLPIRETRDYVAKVLTNYWIYQHRMNRDRASLAVLAEGRRPIYEPVDEQQTQVAEKTESPEDGVVGEE